MRKERVFSIVLIIASLSGLVSSLYPTVPVARTFTLVMTSPISTDIATSLRTATGTMEFNAQYEVVNGVTVSTAEGGLMADLCGMTIQYGYDKSGNPTVEVVPIMSCVVTVTATLTAIRSTVMPAQTGTNLITQTGVVGYVGTGLEGKVALLIVLACFVAGVCLFIKSRKSVFRKR